MYSTVQVVFQLPKTIENSADKEECVDLTEARQNCSKRINQ